MEDEDFTRAEFLAFAAAHDIPVAYMTYVEFDSDFYEGTIIQFTDSNAALDTLEHIHNLNVVCGYVVA